MIFQKALIESLGNNGEKVAIEYGKKLLSYSQLLTASNKITGFLLSTNIEKEARVGIVLKDTADLITSIVGIMNARCVFVPIDSTLPTDRLKAMANDLNLTCVISSKSLVLNDNPFASVPTYFIEELLKAEEPKAVKYPEYEENDSLYIYFTSGSTGKPKGIIGRNCSLLQFVKWEIAAFNVDNTARFSQFISPYFDAFLRDVFVPLVAGGTICIPLQEEDFFSSEKMIPWIDKTGISFIHCVPSVFRIFNNKNLTSENFKSLNHVLLSGEKIVPSELKNWLNHFNTRIQLVNLYGTTETTMIRSFYKIMPEDVNQSKISIGSPIADTELLIANKDLEPCKPLIPGDLYIISKYITKGYLNAPELTSDKFVTLYKGTDKEATAFRTGDKARWMADGKIDLLGREDRQVKIRGIRVELDEIENTLGQAEFIKNAVVVQDTAENDSLVAFVIENAQEDLNIEEEAQKFVKSKLPAYMVPAKVIRVKEYPLLSNGKINYKELLTLQVTQTIVAPADEIEEKILIIWKEILGDRPISTDDSFHSVGGNSLSIMKLIGRIYKEYNVRIALSELFNNLTIKKQADFIKCATKDNLLTISKAEEKPAYNLSASQERLYYNYELNRNSTAYNIPISWEIKGEFDKNKVENTLKALVERHESLRASFEFENGKLSQKVKPSVDFSLEEITDTNKGINEAIAQFIKPFDLSQAPLIRAAVIATQDSRKFLVVDIHHIVCDGMSQQKLYADFLTLYKGGKPKHLDVQFKDYAEWEYNFKIKNEYLSYREFWLKAFEGEIPSLELPTTNSTVGEMSEEGGSVAFKIDRTTIDAITKVLKEEEITTFSGLFSIYYLFLSQLTGQEDIVIGIASSGRIQEELENVVGMFAKTLPIRQQVDPYVSFKDFVNQVHKYLIQANSKQIYDLANIVSELNNGRTSPVENLFETMFAFQNFEHAHAVEDFALYSFEKISAKYPITLYASEGQETFDFRFEYSTHYFTKPDVEMLVEQFKSLIERIADKVDARIIDVIGGSEETTSAVTEDIEFKF